MNNQLVSALQKFKLDVYANLTSKDTLKKYLINVLGYEVWSGQKRLVCFDKQNPGIVYKIAYSSQGIFDNIMEVSCSNKLRLLLQSGQITQDEYMLFGEAQLVNNDPFIITMTAATNYIQDPSFIRWFNMNRSQYPNFNENHMFSMYVASNQQLTSDANRQQQILSNWFKPSDTTVFREPKNFCLRTDNMGRQRLVLIDMGSVCPNLLRNGQYVPIICPKCGQNIVYIPYRISSSLGINNAIKLEGVYGCSNPDCPDYFGTVLSKTTTYESKDSYVFAKYIQDNRDLVRSLYAVDGMYFIPDRRVTNKIEYVNEIRRTLNIQPPAQAVDALYRNYTYFACGMLFNICGDKIQQLPLIQPNGSILTFSSYLNMFNQMLMGIGMAADPITAKTAAYNYIGVLTSRNPNTSIYDVLTQPDWSGFIQNIGSLGLDQQNAQLLFQSLHG